MAALKHGEVYTQSATVAEKATGESQGRKPGDEKSGFF
jgi:hypothetical protein